MRLEEEENWRQGVFWTVLTLIEKQGLEGGKISHMMIKMLFEEWYSKGQEQRKKTIHTLLLHNVLLRAANY